MKVRKTSRRPRRLGFSLIELLAVVTILGIIAVVVIPRIAVSSSTAKADANNQNMSEVNSAVERWYFENGSWPTYLEISTATSYFPEGIPNNPVTGSAYSLNATTHRAQ